jgi:hypothetical protein
VVKPCFTDVYRERGEAVGVAEFETLDDMRLAIRRLDDTEFKNPFEKSYIRIIEVCLRVCVWEGGGVVQAGLSLLLTQAHTLPYHISNTDCTMPRRLMLPRTAGRRFWPRRRRLRRGLWRWRLR